ncbi:MAG: prolipoprotein diacylglyceryl transferase [Polyangiaceae bacterium]
MIPYLDPPPPFTLLGARVSWFGVMQVVAGIATFAALVILGRRMLSRAGAGEPRRAAEGFARVVVGAGLVGAHVGGVLAEHGGAVLGRPSLLVSLSGGLSSAAGLLSAAVAGAGYVVWSGGAPRVFADVAAAALPFGMLPARVGCALVHDHPGRLSSSWLAVRFPGGARFDCGLLEAAALVGLVGLSAALVRRDLRAGTLAGVVGAAYSGVRISLDFLRAGDLPGADGRALGLTLAQWICVALLGASLALALRARG